VILIETKITAKQSCFDRSMRGGAIKGTRESLAIPRFKNRGNK
jgi:hypothetical protein